MEDCGARSRLPILHRLFSRYCILCGQPQAHIHDAPTDRVGHSVWSRRLCRDVLDRDAAFEFSQATFLLVRNADRHNHAHALCRNSNLTRGQSILKEFIIGEQANGGVRHKDRVVVVRDKSGHHIRSRAL